MAFRTFHIALHGAAETERELNQFLRGQRVLAVEKRFYQNGAGDGYWTFCIEYLERAEGGEPAFTGSKVDYKEVLPPEEFAVFSKLRAVRKERADAERLPPFALFSNEQLAEMVRKRVANREQLGQVKGVGEARLEKYGDVVLTVLAEAFGPGKAGVAVPDGPGGEGTP